MEVLFGEEKMVISWSSFVQAAILDPPYSIASHTPCIANTINLHLASLAVGGGGSLPILDKRSANMHYVCMDRLTNHKWDVVLFFCRLLEMNWN